MKAFPGAVREVFVRLYNDGMIYQGDYIVNWCPRCHTAISDLEVEFKKIQVGCGIFAILLPKAKEKYRRDDPAGNDAGRYGRGCQSQR